MASSVSQVQINASTVNPSLHGASRTQKKQHTDPEQSPHDMGVHHNETFIRQARTTFTTAEGH